MSVITVSSIFLLLLQHSQGVKSESPKKVDLKKEILPPCQACKTLVNTFLKGMSNTDKKHFGGGDTAWEEEKLGDYAKSEVRLVEIQENLCAEVQRGQQQCYRLAEEWEQLLEEWWFKVQENNSDIFKWLCIEKVQHCCPENHFGPECKPCDGYPDSVCSNNGKCKGSGTRKGNGECICNVGYGGAKCNVCANSYYESYRDDEKLLCSKCHNACKGTCTSSGPKGCKDCNSGWINDPEHGCLDINECATLDPCKRNEFCINNDGSFSCLACDQSCDGCHGDGPDMCTKCAAGYSLKDGLCVGKDQTQNMEWIRYFTYLGLCIATCIIFQKNTLIASFVGLSVAIYVSVSEYMLHKFSNQNTFY